mmetsp:Transcript_29198/g.43417  ORF Transcript_29198/g.43417 Transcript_29198/m.43417 type:complete len:121 (+) Transcript_29198:337-699(+)
MREKLILILPTGNLASSAVIATAVDVSVLVPAPVAAEAMGRGVVGRNRQNQQKKNRLTHRYKANILFVNLSQKLEPRTEEVLYLYVFLTLSLFSLYQGMKRIFENEPLYFKEHYCCLCIL